MTQFIPMEHRALSGTMRCVLETTFNHQADTIEIIKAVPDIMPFEQINHDDACYIKDEIAA